MDLIERRVRATMQDGDGHGFDHVKRVMDEALRIARIEGADLELVRMTALLHDTDDYKSVGQEAAGELANARLILDEAAVAQIARDAILGSIKTMGYSRSLEGIRPKSLEGMCVSDADMLDAIGLRGIERTIEYGASKGRVLFDPSIAPLDPFVDASEYRAQRKTHTAQHFFDKLLLINGILMTDTGRAAGASKQQEMYDFLDKLFTDAGASAWIEHLAQFRAERGDA